MLAYRYVKRFYAFNSVHTLNAYQRRYSLLIEVCVEICGSLEQMDASSEVLITRVDVFAVAYDVCQSWIALVQAFLLTHLERLEDRNMLAGVF